MSFVKADRVATHVRIGLFGATNAGKTLSAIYAAMGLVIGGYKTEGVENPTLEQISERIAFIGTERKRGLFYANRIDLKIPTGSFYYMQITPPYNPDKFITAGKEAAELVGPKGVVIFDSLSHAWAYSGGVLQIKENIAKQKGKTSYTAWNEAGEIQNSMIDQIMGIPANTIGTMRSKMEYVLEKNHNDKYVPIQVGMKPIQRDDVEYEFDITLQITKPNHEAIIVKDTTYLGNLHEVLPPLTPQWGTDLFDWLNQGVNPEVFKQRQLGANINEIQILAGANQALITIYKTKLFPNTSAKDLTLEQSQYVLKEFKEFLNTQSKLEEN